MTTETEIDPRLVCLACGWEADSDGRVRDLEHGLTVPLDVEVCDGGAYMSHVLQALEPRRPAMIYIRLHGLWACTAWGTGDRIAAPTPHEAVYALATKIGRSMETNR